ncbi:Sterol uptake control protein 2-like protein 1 [Colletotrichum musicola]|uniref:Sterol uptake control protein 2-like protein 1 n=1 Tax=Colletotrichum musicola TaxID=2175873 RepID=A0A8H6KDG8_9PEZI|nr:Sterol uptake control protein 2-like protein 1 [Colletotrichum musicola]
MRSTPRTPTASPGHPPAKQHRKPHSKSKSGCADCRRRRVKCDERHPTCGSCLRREVPCVYRTEAEVRVTAASAGSPSPSLSIPGHGNDVPTDDQLSSTASIHTGALSRSRSDSVSPIALSPFSFVTTVSHSDIPKFTLHDLGLMHHWTISTSKTVADNDKLGPIWQVLMPQIASQHEFLMHGILCLSATHLSHEKGYMKTSFIKEAAAHHNLAIQGFNQAISDMDEHNSEALFAFASINIICIFALYRRLGDISVDPVRCNTKNRILGLEWVTMIRGVKFLLEPIHQVVWSGPLRVMLDIGNWEDLIPDEATSASAQRLREIRSSWKDSNDAQAYEEVLSLLIRCFMFVEQFSTMDAATLDSWGQNRAMAGPMLFIYYAPEHFFLKVKQRQPPALLIFAYLGASIHELRSKWYIEGWGREIVEVVDDLLGDYWRPWTAWPLEVVKLE